MKNKIFLLTVIAFVGLGLFAYYLYTKPVSSTNSINTDIKISANKLLHEYEENEAQANSIYLDKVIEVSGIVENIEYVNNKTSVYLQTGNKMSSVICQLEQSNELLKIKKGDFVNIKGICTGYLMDVVLVRSVIF